MDDDDDYDDVDPEVYVCHTSSKETVLDFLGFLVDDGTQLDLLPLEITPGWARTPMGLPRPRSVPDGRLPVPYVASDVDNLGQTSAERLYLCVIDGRCQVCGRKFDEGEDALVAAAFGHRIVIDGAAIHPVGCWPLALKHCPHLQGIHESGALLVWIQPISDYKIDVVEVDGRRLEGYACPPFEKGNMYLNDRIRELLAAEGEPG